MVPHTKQYLLVRDIALLFPVPVKLQPAVAALEADRHIIRVGRVGIGDWDVSEGTVICIGSMLVETCVV